MDTVQRDTITNSHGLSFLRGNNAIFDSTNSEEKQNSQKYEKILCQESAWRHFTVSASQPKAQSRAKIVHGLSLAF